jgi:hypothetical protein
VGSGAGEGFSINLPVPARSDEDAWVSLLEHVAVPAALESGPDLGLISAGYDAHRDDVQGGCELEAGSFSEMARHLRALGEEVGAPVGVVLEGGYALHALAASVAATLEALAGDELPAEVESAIVAHKKVADAAVVAQADELTGQAIVAIVTLQGDVDGDRGPDPRARRRAHRQAGAAEAHPVERRSTQTRSGKIVRRLVRDIAEGRALGHVTTLRDPTAMAELAQRISAAQEQAE